MIPPSSSVSIIDTSSSSAKKEARTNYNRKASRKRLLRQQSLFFLCSCAVLISVPYDPCMLLFPVVTAFAFRTTVVPTTTTKTTRNNKLSATIRRREVGSSVYGDHTCPLRREHLESVMTTTEAVASSVSRSSAILFHSKSSSTSASASYLDSISYQPPSIMEEQLVGATSNYLETLSSVSLMVPTTTGSNGVDSGTVMEESVAVPLLSPPSLIVVPPPSAVNKDDDNNRVMQADNEEQQQQQQQQTVAAPPPPPNVKKSTRKASAAKADSSGSGLFAPAVLLTKDIVGDTKLKKLRSTIIGMHADVIGKFTSTSQTDFGNQVLKVLFALADKDNNGTIDEEEFTVALQALGFDFLKEKQIASIFKRADGDKNGTLDIDEWTNTVPTLLKVNLTLLAKKNGHELGFMA